MDGVVWIGKKVKLVFQDSEKVLIKFGVVSAYDNSFINFSNENGINEIIPVNRILRLEVLK